MSKIHHPPPGAHVMHYPHGPHHPHGNKAAKTSPVRKAKRGKHVDASGLEGEIESAPAPAEVDRVEDAEGAHAFGERRPPTPTVPLIDEPDAEPRGDGVALAEPSAEWFVAEIRARFARLAEFTDAPLRAPHAAQEIALRRAETLQELGELLRQVFTGDFGFKPTHDPQIGLGRLFADLPAWPREVPPGRAPAAGAPWSVAEWNSLVQWLFAPPPLPAGLGGL